ncbi:MAG: 2-C-methyl-D-erythritol 4-phosphate cytidylyltransferase [Dysgonamonadaceae bacterium]|jgi:2-C-methyl-D-erythritol 4-phosphate cytidylyltransferase|nr:2-C-methyl-D-erythritol 4-phosphate cytidylyltransferase [Dysgonamonadaceae bacterium]
MRKYAIIVAAGNGSRMGTDIPKQYLLLQGKPVLMHTLAAFYNYDSQLQIILVLAPDQKEYWRRLCREYDFTIPHTLVDGGKTRFHSVKNGLEEVYGEALVAVHDGVRPIVDLDLLDSLFHVAGERKGAFPVIPVVDTLRRKTNNGGSKIMERSQFRLVQTPQVFLSRILFHAYQAEYSEKFTDDVSVVESRRLCKPVMVAGRRENIKITTPVDLIIAEAVLNRR